MGRYGIMFSVLYTLFSCKIFLMILEAHVDMAEGGEMKKIFGKWREIMGKWGNDKKSGVR